MRFAKAGFEGPMPGAGHQQMWRGNLKVRIPNPHGAAIGHRLLASILRQAGISREEWEKL